MGKKNLRAFNSFRVTYFGRCHSFFYAGAASLGIQHLLSYKGKLGVKNGTFLFLRFHPSSTNFLIDELLRSVLKFSGLLHYVTEPDIFLPIRRDTLLRGGWQATSYFLTKACLNAAADFLEMNGATIAAGNSLTLLRSRRLDAPCGGTAAKAAELTDDC